MNKYFLYIWISLLPYHVSKSFNSKTPGADVSFLHGRVISHLCSGVYFFMGRKYGISELNQLRPKDSRLTAIEDTGEKNKSNSRLILCVCVCGKVKTIVLSELLNGHTRSCGCLQIESRDTTTHGLTKHPLYRVWSGMKERCNNPNFNGYKNYGGRGIKICNEWDNDFKIFYDWAIGNGWRKGLEIDRINNNLGYYPSNCQFVTRKINSRNKRATKLSPELAQFIRSSELRTCELSRLLGIKWCTIQNVRNNKSWL